MRRSQVLTSQNGLRVRPKRALFSLKKVLKLSSSGLATQICRLRRISPEGVKISGRGTPATPQEISSPQDIGLVRLGEVEMRVEDVLSKLEKHEAECNLRYTRIEERLDDHKNNLKSLDIKLWGLAVLIVVSPLVHKLWG
jgi:hypothetical protein